MSEPQAPAIHQQFTGDALGVRQALADTIAALAPRQFTEQDLGTVEIVLAEVLNNIVEHAYDGGPGPIELALHTDPLGLKVRVADIGRPFPGGVLPEGQRRNLQDEAGLPEGGFGWLLIRDLARDLEYRRDGARNRLSFTLLPRQSGGKA